MAFAVNSESQLLLCEIFNQISLQEKKIEQLRIQLCRKTSFNPYATYKLLSEGNQIGNLQIIQFLRDNNLVVQDANILFKYIKAEYLTYQDFLQLILPKTDQQLREINALKQPALGQIEQSILVILAQLINLEINEYNNLERLKVRITKQYTPQELYECIDSLNQGQLSNKDIDRFFRRNGLLLYEDEIYRIFIRIDAQRTGYIMFNDFNEYLTPFYEEIQIKPRRASQTGRIVSTSLQQPRYEQQINQSKQSNQQPRMISTSLQQTLPPRIGSTQQIQVPTISSPKYTEEMSTNTIVSNSDQQYEQYLCNRDQSFIDLMIDIFKMEMYIEELKIQLVRQPDFNTMDCFHFIDINSQGKVNQLEVTKFLKRIGIKSYGISQLFKHLDRDNDGYIRFSDFNDFISPCTIEIHQKKPVNGNLKYSLHKLFNSDTIKLIHTIFTSWFHNESMIKQRVNSLKLNFHQAFDIIDHKRQGSFTLSDLQHFLSSNQIHEDAKVLFKRFAKNKKEVYFKNFLNRLNVEK